MFEKTSPQEAAGHNSVPPSKPHYCGPGLLMDYPLENLFEFFFKKTGFNKVSYILGNWAFLRISNERN